MQVLALGGRLHHFADVDAVLDDGLALAVVLKRELVADGNVVPRHDLDIFVVFHDPASEMLTSLDAFHDDDADAVAFLVHHKMDHALTWGRKAYSIRMPDRRTFLVALGAFASSHALGQLNSKPRFSASPFTLGVASGYPQPGALVLWTRLAPAPRAPGVGMTPESIPVGWEIARDEHLKQIVASGTAYATPEWAHCVHVEVGGLEPRHPYWYRFTAGDA